MTPLDRVRTAALALPETEERVGDPPTFVVAGEPFAQVRDDGRPVVRVKVSGADEQAMLPAAASYSRPIRSDTPDWAGIPIDGDPDWQLVEDRIARSWELAAPRRLLEAGGR